MEKVKRYRQFPIFRYPERTWMDKEVEKAPIWCSVDLRDGNQALVEPMGVEEKIEYFQLLCRLGFKEIEVGFPAASQIEYDFLRNLVERKLIPEDVTVQILVQCREELIERSFEALEGVKKAIVHIYNSTSILQREVVFKKSKEEIKAIALSGVEMVKRLEKNFHGELRLEYSPESFTGTEIDYALEVCNAVISAWGTAKNRKIIINLPSTVEMHSPNVFADQIEFMSDHLLERENVVLSIHPHNDRGEGIAAAELALLAGANRIEGTLFGNGERTGNVDILTLAYNMFSHGIDPALNLENIREIKEVYERCTKMQIPDRHPYAGKLVFTAFSGSHQDAINKGLQAMKEHSSLLWEVPYLPIDPADIGREYEPVVRINSQSGKGGVAFILDYQYGYKLPKGMQREFADYIQFISEKEGEVDPERILKVFTEEYVEAKKPLFFKNLRSMDMEDEKNGYVSFVQLSFENRGVLKEVSASGSGPIEATVNALRKELKKDFTVMDYNEHALGAEASAKAVSYIHLMDRESGKSTFGVGISSNITRSSVRALFSAINRLYYPKTAEG